MYCISESIRTLQHTLYYIKVTSADTIIRMINDTMNYNIKMYYISRTNYQLYNFTNAIKKKPIKF